MVVATYFNYEWTKSWYNGTGCENRKIQSELAIGSTCIVYISYFILFMKFFIERYILAKPKSAGAKGTTTEVKHKKL